MAYPLSFDPGTLFHQGRYRLQYVLNQGRNSITLVALDHAQNKPVILKLPRDSQGLLPYHRHRFQTIWQRCGHFQYPSLQQTLQYFEEEGIPCLVLEAIPGQSLAQKLQEAPLPEAMALRWITQVGKGLQQLHDRGIIHGNLAPQNLKLHTHSQGIVLVDWGLFWLTTSRGDPLSAYSPPEPFMPPEIRLNVDIYSLAATLYTLITGEIPPTASQRLAGQGIPSPEQLTFPPSPKTYQAMLQGMMLNSDLRCPSVQSWLTLLPQLDTTPVTQLTRLPSAGGVAQPSPLEPTTFWEARLPGAVAPEDPVERAAQGKQGTIAPETPFDQKRAVQPLPTRPNPWPKLGLALVLGTLMGGLGGLAFRWQAQPLGKTSRMLPPQTFPRQDWPGTLEPELPDQAPIPEFQGNDGGQASSWDEVPFTSQEEPLFWETPEPEVFYPETIAPDETGDPRTLETGTDDLGDTNNLETTPEESSDPIVDPVPPLVDPEVVVDPNIDTPAPEVDNGESQGRSQGDPRNSTPPVPPNDRPTDPEG